MFGGIWWNGTDDIIEQLALRFDLQGKVSQVKAHVWHVFDIVYLQSKADAFEFADQVLEKWYPTLEEGDNKGIVVLVTSQKEGAITGGPSFVKAVGEDILDATVSENLPGKTSHFNLFSWMGDE